MKTNLVMIIVNPKQTAQAPENDKTKKKLKLCKIFINLPRFGHNKIILSKIRKVQTKTDFYKTSNKTFSSLNITERKYPDFIE